jgi:hypothetical protein
MKPASEVPVFEAARVVRRLLGNAIQAQAEAPWARTHGLFLVPHL